MKPQIKTHRYSLKTITSEMSNFAGFVNDIVRAEFAGFGTASNITIGPLYNDLN